MRIGIDPRRALRRRVASLLVRTPQTHQVLREIAALRWMTGSLWLEGWFHATDQEHIRSGSAAHSGSCCCLWSSTHAMHTLFTVW
jgi:hypothetical protein